MIFRHLPLLVILALGAPYLPMVAAAEKEEKKTDKSADKDDQPKAIRLKIPERLRGEGLRLLLDEKEYDLNKDELELTPTLDSVAVELYDAKGRLRDYRRDYVDDELFEKIRARRFRFQLELGSVHPSASGPWREIFLSGDRFQMGGEFGWNFAGGFAANLMLLLQDQSADFDEGFTARYRGYYSGVNFLYRWAVLSSVKNYFKKVTLTPKLGVFYAQHTASIKDSEVSLEDNSSNVGYSGGLGIEFPVFSNFNFAWNYTLMLQRIELPELGFESTQPDHSILIGGAYAF